MPRLHGLHVILMLVAAAPAAARAPAPERLYVEARLAAAAQEPAAALERFAELLKTEDSSTLRRRALDVAIVGGDAKAAATLAHGIDTPPSPPGDPMLALTRMALAARAGDWKAFAAARAGFVEPSGGTGTPVVGRILSAWAAAGARRRDDALAFLDPSDSKGAARSYLVEHRAHMLAMAKRWPEAAAAYAEIVAAEGSNVPRLRLAAAASALEAGRHDPKWRERGIALLAGGPANDPLLAPARAKVADDPNVSGRKLGGTLRSPAEGVAELLLRVAVDLGRDRLAAPALVFARLSTFAAPGLPEAWIATADLLARDGRRPLALEAIDRVASFGPAYARIAVIGRAGILADDGQYAEATRLMAAVAAEPQAGVEEWSALADIERRAGDHPAAAAHFGRAIELLPADAEPERRAMLLFLRGSSEEQAGDWAAAETHLRAALALVPDNPIYLNYLGYSLLDRGLKPAESRELIERAFAAAPESGAIIDSMGWTLFVAGDYAGAVALLERARAAEPADPTVADHLGDALWRTGRRIEARYAWTAALDQEPPAKLKERLLGKRDLGLDLAR